MSLHARQKEELSCSVVIRCFNEERHIGRLLNGLMQQTIRNLDIIVVDSGSSDSTVSIASRYPVRILSIRPEEFSFGRSLNLGCRAAKNEFIVIASAHVYPLYKDWLERLLAPFDGSEVALVYGKQRGNGTTKYSEHQVFAHWFPEESNLCQDTPFCNNANAAIRRSVWERLPYEESLTGLEDLDFARRAMDAGYKIAYVADAEVTHVHRENPKRLRNRYMREAIALKRIFPQEHFGLWDFVKLFTANLFSDFSHALSEGVLCQHLREILLFRLMQFWGTYRGFSQEGGITSMLKQTFYYPHDMLKPPLPKSLVEPRPCIEYPALSIED